MINEINIFHIRTRILIANSLKEKKQMLNGKGNEV